jgi:hypothetical protein
VNFPGCPQTEGGVAAKQSPKFPLPPSVVRLCSPVNGRFGVLPAMRGHPAPYQFTMVVWRRRVDRARLVRDFYGSALRKCQRAVELVMSARCRQSRQWYWSLCLPHRSCLVFIGLAGLDLHGHQGVIDLDRVRLDEESGTFSFWCASSLPVALNVIVSS